MRTLGDVFSRRSLDRSRTRASGSGAASLGSLAAMALLPKCPVCVAAWLAAFGVGGGIASTVAPFVRPLVFTLAVVAGARLAWVLCTARKRVAPRVTGGCPACAASQMP